MDAELRRYSHFEEHHTEDDLDDHFDCLDTLKSGLRVALKTVLQVTRAAPASGPSAVSEADACFLLIERTLGGQHCAFGGQIFRMKETCLVLLNLLKLLPEPALGSASTGLVRTLVRLTEQLGRLDHQFPRSLLVGCVEAISVVSALQPWHLVGKLEAFGQFAHRCQLACSDNASTSGLKFELAPADRLIAFCTRLFSLAGCVVRNLRPFLPSYDLETLWLAVINATTSVAEWGQEAVGASSMLFASLQCIHCLLISCSGCPVDQVAALRATAGSYAMTFQVQWRLVSAIPRFAGTILNSTEEFRDDKRMVSEILVFLISNCDEALIFPQLNEVLKPFAAAVDRDNCWYDVLIVAARRFGCAGIPSAMLWRPLLLGVASPFLPPVPEVYVSCGNALRQLAAHITLSRQAVDLARKVPHGGNATQALLLLSLAIRAFPSPEASPLDTICLEVRQRFMEAVRAFVRIPDLVHAHLGTLEVVLETIRDAEGLRFDSLLEGRDVVSELVKVASNTAKPSQDARRVLVLSFSLIAASSESQLSSRCRLLIEVAKRRLHPEVESALWYVIGHALEEHSQARLGASSRRVNDSLSDASDEELRHVFVELLDVFNWRISNDNVGDCRAFGSALALFFSQLVTFAWSISTLLETSPDLSMTPDFRQSFVLSSPFLNSATLMCLGSSCSSAPNPIRLLAHLPSVCALRQQTRNGSSLAIGVGSPLDRFEDGRGCWQLLRCSSCSPCCHGDLGRPVAALRAVIPPLRVVGRDPRCTFLLERLPCGLAWLLHSGQGGTNKASSSCLKCGAELLQSYARLHRRLGLSGAEVPSGVMHKSVLQLFEPGEDEVLNVLDVPCTTAALVWCLCCSFLSACASASRLALRASAGLLTGFLRQLLSQRQGVGAGWERSAATGLLLSLFASREFVEALSQVDGNISEHEMFVRCHQWRLECCGLQSGEDSSKALLGVESQDLLPLRPSANTAACQPMVMRAICCEAPRSVVATYVVQLVAGAVALSSPPTSQLPVEAARPRLSPSLCLQSLLAFGMLAPLSSDALFRTLRGNVYLNLFVQYSHTNARVDSLCRLLLCGSVRAHVRALLPKLLPAMVLSENINAIRDLGSLLDESVQSLFTPRLPFVLSAVARQPLERVAGAFHFILERVYQNQMTITGICDASLGKLLVLILWSSSCPVPKSKRSDGDRILGQFAVAKARALAAIDTIVGALRVHNQSPGTGGCVGSQKHSHSLESKPKRRKLSDWMGEGSKGRSYDSGSEDIRPSEVVVQTLVDNLLHVLDIFEILLSRGPESLKWAEYSVLVRDPHSCGSMDYSRLFSAVALLFDLVAGSLHRFAPKILEFLQSTTSLPDFEPESARCWSIFVRSIGLESLLPLLPAVFGEGLRFAAKLRGLSPERSGLFCEDLSTVVMKVCSSHHESAASIPALPAWPELECARAALQQAQGTRGGENFAASLEAGIIRMEVAPQQAVKSAALRHLLEIVSINRRVSARAIVELPQALLVRLLQALLTLLWESSAWPDDQLKCGELLGMIGAVDPTRFGQFDLSKDPHASRTPEHVGNMELLAKRVLTEFLAPSITSKNSYAFSAQEILKYLAAAGKWEAVEKDLKLDIRETLRPYSQSSYKLVEPAQRSSAEDSFLSTFDHVVAQATSLVQGQQRAFFEACLPAAHGNRALALFLMHHVLHHVIRSSTPRADLEELSKSLAKLLEAPEHSTVQAIFSIVDDMTERREQLQQTLLGATKPADVTAGKKQVERIDEILCWITPRRVVAASMQCGAHARALQFLERSLSSDDGAPTDSPTIQSEEDCLLLQSIYRALQEPDGVLGAFRVGSVTARTRTLHLEEAGRWHEALSCYEEQLAILSIMPRTESTPEGDNVVATQDAQRRDLLCGLVRCNQNMRRFESSLHMISSTESDAVMCERLRPFAVEAAWQLSQWDGLGAALGSRSVASGMSPCATRPNNLSVSDLGLVASIGRDCNDGVEDEFQLGIGRALLAIHRRSGEALCDVLRETTLRVTCEAAAAARESYDRAYQHLLKLHVLSDIEWLWREASGGKGLRVATGGSTSESRSSSENNSAGVGLALHLLERIDTIAPTFAARQQVLNPLRVAFLDLGFIEGAKRLELAFVRLCRKHHSQVPIAMQYPASSFSGVSADLLAQARIEYGKLLYVQGSRQEALSQMQQLAGDHPRARLLGTRWATEASSELLIPRAAEAEFLRAKEALPDDEAAWFYHASYLDRLLKEQLRSRAAVSGASASSTAARALRRAGSASASPFDLENLVTFTLRGYLQAMHRGNKRMHFIMSRVLQLAWDCCELDLHKAEALSEIEAQNETMQPWMWYVVMTQLISRVHNLDMRTLFSKLIMKVVHAYPWQAGWQMIQLLKSSNKDHYKLGHEMVLGISRSSKDVHGLLSRYYTICEVLISLANHVPTDNATTMSLRVNFPKLLGGKSDASAWSLMVPLQAQMTAVIPRVGLGQPPASPFPEKILSQRCLENVEVFRSKERPKRITFVGSDGKFYPFLCKAERRGDLRKDSRLMEFGVTVNQLLQKNPDTRRRNLSMRTFNVVIFAESTGLIEWVPNTRGMRLIIDDLWRRLRPGQQQSARDVKELLDRSRDIYETFTKQVLPRHPPVLHHWFGIGADPSTWLSRRMKFSRSQALWCMFGYVLGLGDRHGENILLDTEQGTMVHVDFDCLFGKGMLLERPETVPFRLTQNCVAAMGATGVEGIFRQACELCMSVLRDHANQQTLLSVLHAFIADPLIDWSNRGRQDKDDHRIQQARATIGDVEKKLNGMLNVGAVVDGLPPHLEQDSVLSSEERGRSLLGKDRGVGLSVEGQVDELLKAAMCKRNLSEMYVGWQPWM